MLFYIMINMYMLNCINKYLFVYIYIHIYVYIINGYINHIITDNIYIHKYQRMCVLKNLWTSFRDLFLSGYEWRPIRLYLWYFYTVPFFGGRTFAEGPPSPAWLGYQLWDEAVSCFCVVKVCVKVGKGVLWP